MPLIQASLSRSRLTPMMLNPRSLYASYRPTSAGFAARQGLHHDAQKSISLSFPSTLNKLSISPSGVAGLKSVNVAPTDDFSRATIFSDNFMKSGELWYSALI